MHDKFEPPVNYPLMDESDFSELEREQKREQSFINKWLTTGVRNDIGAYWSRTPSRVYWALIFDTVLGDDQLVMAKDLIALYEDVNSSTSALLHARYLIASCSV